MKYIVAVIAVLALSTFASDPVKEAKKRDAKKEEKLREQIKKYGLKETPGYKIIGVSEPYFLIDGVQVPCDSVEMKCENGKCKLVPKK